MRRVYNHKWERNLAMMKTRIESGSTYRQLAAEFGITYERARQVVSNTARKLNGINFHETGEYLLTKGEDGGHCYQAHVNDPRWLPLIGKALKGENHGER